MDVLVVGAGLGGLAAAVALRQAGHTVTVLERAPALRETGSGLGLMPNGVLALDALGVGPEVREWASPNVENAARDRTGRVLMALSTPELARRAGAPLCVAPRRWLHGLLAAKLPAEAIRTGVAVEAVRPDGDRLGVTGPDTDGDRVGPTGPGTDGDRVGVTGSGADGIGPTGPGSDGDRVGVTGSGADGIGPADLVVAADGAGSRLRAGLFPTHPGLAGSGEIAARGIAPSPAGVTVTAGELLDHRTGDRFGIQPMTGGTVYWYATWRAESPADPAELRRWLLDRRADWHPSVPALIEATPAEDIHVGETTRLVRPLPSLVAGRVALLGDAAHAMTPDLGQGACLAFEDAVVLGAVLDRADPADVPAALRGYDARRSPRTAALHKQSRRTQRAMTLTGLTGRLRDGLIRLVPPAAATRATAAQFRFDPAG